MANQRRDTEFLKEVAQKLRRLRNDKGVSQDSVYIDTDVNVKRIEVGNINISLTTLKILCKHYGVTLEEFFRDIETV